MSIFYQELQTNYGLSDDILAALEKAAADCAPYLQSIRETVEYNQLKVLHAFQEANVSDFHLSGSTGYGYGDSGRDTLEEVYAAVFRCEKALVRSQIVSGTHAIAIGLLGNLENGDELISATGKPYDTLLKVIGSREEYGTLSNLGVKYTEIQLTGGKTIDLDKLLQAITPRAKIVYFQRSGGYEQRPSFSMEDLKQAITAVKERYPHVICMVDNCYGEFVEKEEPTQAGADLVAGSLIKNPGGGLALSGGYLAGRSQPVSRAAARLTAPGIGAGVGASLNFNRPAFQGLFMAPLIVGEALQGAVLAARFFELLGFPVQPVYSERRADIIQSIRLGSKELMAAFCRGLQKACPLDAHVRPEPALLPGYSDEVIMAGGTFIQGSSIELSADGPIRPPYCVYLQGGLSMSHVKIGLALAAQAVLKEKGGG